MQQVLANQQNSLNKLLELSKQDRLLQLTQTKDTLNIDNKSDQQLEQLKKIDASIKDLNVVSNDKGKNGITSNVIKLFTEIKKTTEQVKQLAQVQSAQPLSKAQAKDITGKAMERRQYRSIGDRVGEFKEKAKDFFTMRGFLDKTGIVKRGTGGIFSDALDRREERQKYVASRLKMDPTARLHGVEKASQIFSRQFDEQQNIQRNIRKNESALSTYKKQGFTEEQIKRTEEFKKRDSLATDLAKVDTRVRPEGFDPKTGLIKEKPKTAKQQAEKNSVISAVKPQLTLVKSEKVSNNNTNKDSVKSEKVSNNNVEKISNNNTNTNKESIISAIKPEVITEKKVSEPSKPKSANKQKATASAAVSSVISAIKPEVITEKPKSAAEQSTSLISHITPKKADQNAEQAASALNSEEATLETNKKIDDETDILRKIEKNTRPHDAEKIKPEEESGIGGLAAIAAGIIGGIIGFAKAWVKTIKLFFETLMPESLKSFIGEKFQAIGKFFEEMGTKIKSLFSFGEESRIGKFIEGLKDGVAKLTKPFVEAYETVKGMLTGSEFLGKIFSSIGEYMSKFGKYIAKVAVIAEKIFYPILVIMTLWDTVKGAFEGWEKGGLVGAIGGAIKGFFNSLVFGFVDLIKDGISWVAGALGFKNIEKLLDSFSFEKMFDDFVDMIMFIPQKIQDLIMHPIDSLQKLGDMVVDAFGKIGEIFKPVTDFFKGIGDSVISMLQSIRIPEIGFTIPVIDKKVSIGPFEPFGKASANQITGGNSNAGAGQGSSQFAATDPRRVDVAPTPANSPQSGNSVAKQSEQNREANMNASKPSTGGGNTIVSAPTVNNVQNTQQTIKLQPRNRENSLSNYLSSRYA